VRDLGEEEVWSDEMKKHLSLCLFRLCLCLLLIDVYDFCCLRFLSTSDFFDFFRPFFFSQFLGDAQRMLFCLNCGKMLQTKADSLKAQVQVAGETVKRVKKANKALPVAHSQEELDSAEGKHLSLKQELQLLLERPPLPAGRKVKRLVCQTCRDNELAVWWQGGLVVELLIDDVGQFGNTQQANFRKAIAEAATTGMCGGEEDGGALEALVVINKIVPSTMHLPILAVRVEFVLDVENEHEVPEMRRKLDFHNVQASLQAQGLHVLAFAGAAAERKKKGKSFFPAALKAGVKAACAENDDDYRHFVYICTSFARDKTIRRRQALKEFTQLLLRTPLAEEEGLVTARSLLQEFRAWTKQQLPPKEGDDAVVGGGGEARTHAARCIRGQESCFLCPLGEAWCACCTLLAPKYQY
jgi:hypothetical protein